LQKVRKDIETKELVEKARAEADLVLSLIRYNTIEVNICQSSAAFGDGVLDAWQWNRRRKDWNAECL